MTLVSLEPNITTDIVIGLVTSIIGGLILLWILSPPKRKYDIFSYFKEWYPTISIYFRTLIGVLFILFTILFYTWEAFSLFKCIVIVSLILIHLFLDWLVDELREFPETKPEVFCPDKAFKNSSTNPEQLIIPADIIRQPIGSISTWLLLEPIGKENHIPKTNEYIFGHATYGGTTLPGLPNDDSGYQNVFALRITPACKWDLWLNTDVCKTDHKPSKADVDSQFAWQHILLRWDRGKNLFELKVDGEIEIRFDDPNSHWPNAFSEKLCVGFWPSMFRGHFVNAHFWRVRILDYFLDGEYLQAELRLTPPPLKKI